MNRKRTVRRHPLVIKTEETLTSRTPDEYGMLRARRASCLNVRASPRSIARALRIMNRLLSAIENDGHKVMITAEEKPRTMALIDGQQIPFSLWESSRSREHVLSKTEAMESKQHPHRSFGRWGFRPTGQLTLEIDRWRFWGVRTMWADGKRGRLEQQLDSILEGMRQAAAKAKEIEAEHLRERQAREAEEQRRLDEQRRLEEEQRRIRELSQQATSWRQGRLVKQFLDHVREKALSSGMSCDSESKLGRWLAWATEQGDKLDPTKGILAKCEPAPTTPIVSDPQSNLGGVESNNLPTQMPSQEPVRSITEVSSGRSGTEAPLDKSSNGQEKQKEEGARSRRRLERTVLYQQVWSQPVQQVAKSYGISGRGLGKACRRLLVPVPPRGYWARVRNGYKEKKPPLPKLNGQAPTPSVS